MTPYILWFLAALAIFLLTYRRPGERSAALLAAYLLPLCLFVGMGDMLGGYDRYIYAELFDSIADTVAAGGNPFTGEAFQFYASEPGYGTICVLIAHVTANRYIFILLLTLLIYTLLFFSIRRYTDSHPLAVILFLGLWFFFTFTYLRQVLGATVMWLGIGYIARRDLKRFLLVWLIAYSIHNSAIVFLPMYFVPVRKYSAPLVIGVMAVMLLIGLSPVPNALFDVYGENVERMAEYNAEEGFRVAYFLEALFFLTLILWRYRHIPNDRRDLVLLNIALVFCAILLVFIRSENGGRLAWYYMIGVIATLTNLARRSRSALESLVIVSMSFLLYWRILTGWGDTGILYPYKTFLVPGHTGAEWVYERYEYAPQYDIDKFYR